MGKVEINNDSVRLVQKRNQGDGVDGALQFRHLAWYDNNEKCNAKNQQETNDNVFFHSEKSKEFRRLGGKCFFSSFFLLPSC